MENKLQPPQRLCVAEAEEENVLGSITLHGSISLIQFLRTLL